MGVDLHLKAKEDKVIRGHHREPAPEMRPLRRQLLLLWTAEPRTVEEDLTKAPHREPVPVVRPLRRRQTGVLAPVDKIADRIILLKDVRKKSLLVTTPLLIEDVPSRKEDVSF